jgi:hypothetical protein
MFYVSHNFAITVWTFNIFAFVHDDDHFAVETCTAYEGRNEMFLTYVWVTAHNRPWMIDSNGMQSLNIYMKTEIKLSRFSEKGIISVNVKLMEALIVIFCKMEKRKRLSVILKYEY